VGIVAGSSFIGPRFLLGTAGDQDVCLGVDSYNRTASVVGVNTTLNTVAFDLSTGKAAAPRSIAEDI
jgi:hypothetical protein